MTRTGALAAMVVGGCVALAAAQSRPDFSGRWTTDPEPAPAGRGPSAAPGDMGSGWGSTITIAQDASRLTVEYAFFGRGDLQPPLRFVYSLDGSESRNSVMMGRGVQVQSSRAAWENQTLIITTVHPFVEPASGKPLTATVTHRLSLASPASLVVEVTRDGVLGGPPSTTRTVYRRI